MLFNSQTEHSFDYDRISEKLRASNDEGKVSRVLGEKEQWNEAVARELLKEP